MNVSIAMEEDAADDVGAPVMDENDIEEDEEEEGGAQVKKKKKKGHQSDFFSQAADEQGAHEAAPEADAASEAADMLNSVVGKLTFTHIRLAGVFPGLSHFQDLPPLLFLCAISRCFKFALALNHQLEWLLLHYFGSLCEILNNTYSSRNCHAESGHSHQWHSHPSLCGWCAGHQPDPGCGA